MQRRPSNIEGMRFGYLVALKRLPNEGKYPAWECQCDCGVLFNARSKNLFTEKTTHCGCKNQTANFSKEDEQWLIQVSGTISHAQAAEKLNISLNQLRSFLKKKDIHWKQSHKWSAEEDQWLKENATKITYEEAGQHLGTDRETVRTRARRLGISWTTRGKKVNREVLDVPDEWKRMPDNQQTGLLQGLTQYFTGRPCDNGHISPRNTKSGGCLVCVNERNKNQYFADHDAKKTDGRERASARRLDGREKKYMDHRGRELVRLRTRKRELTDPNFYLSRRLRARSKNAIKFSTGKRATLKSNQLHGCSIAHIRSHIESLFQDGMTWENHGHGDNAWHIDEIRPISSFDLTDEEQQKICFNWRNRQPLWGSENLAKSDIYEPHNEVEWGSRMRELGYEGELFLLFEEGRGGL